MKIEAGNNVFVLDFNGSVNQEEQAFLEVAKYMIDKKLDIKSVEENVTLLPKETIRPSAEAVLIKTDVAPKKQNQIENTNINNKVQQSRQKYDSVRGFLESQERRLVIGECECKKDFHFLIDDPNQKELRFICKHCGEEKVVNLDDLVPATYKCDKCGKQSSFWMEAAQAVAIDCVSCKAEIDMYYHDKKKIMTNQF